MKKMDPELKKEWLEALRSGEYEQGRGCLCKGGKFCCLGVLYDQTDAYWFSASLQKSFWLTEGGRSASFGEDVFGYTAVNSLIWMNDTGKSFEEIAGWIEENL